MLQARRKMAKGARKLQTSEKKSEVQVKIPALLLAFMKLHATQKGATAPTQKAARFPQAPLLTKL